MKPYGDTLDDGMVQLSFTLPVEDGEKAKKAAEMYVSMLNFKNISVVYHKMISDGFTYFVVYAEAIPDLDFSTVEVEEIKTEYMDFYKINELIEKEIGRKLVAVGATIGTDAHTVGIDAIMNMKGYHGDYGLERYSGFESYNMGAQITVNELLEKAIDVEADAILVSQTVTQKNAHIKNFSDFMRLVNESELRDKFIILAGGARVDNHLALKLGYDAGFGKGTVASQAASFIVNKFLEKRHD
jgi:beta-lysine 5,6-aminomutase beta subunit